jgi:hypothetical protein
MKRTRRLSERPRPRVQVFQTISNNCLSREGACVPLFQTVNIFGVEAELFERNGAIHFVVFAFDGD